MNVDKAKSSVSVIVESYLQAAGIVQQGIFFVTEKGDLIGANEGFLSELGYDATSINKKSILEIVPHFSLIKWKNLWNQLLKERQISLRTDLLNQEEMLVPVSLKWLLLEAEKEKIGCGIVESLMEKNRYRDMMLLTAEVAAVGGWEWDLTKHQILLTGESCRILDVGSQEQVLTEEQFRSILDKRIYSEDRDRLRESLDRAVKLGHNFELELAARPLKGEPERFFIHGRPVQSEGITYKIYGAVQDISSLTARHESMYLTQFSVDQAAEMIVWVNDKGEFLYANNSFCKEMGYTKEELLADVNILQIARNYSQEQRMKIRSDLAEKGTGELETEFTRRDGSVILVSCNLNHIVYQGQNIDCAFCKNITNKKTRDRELKLSKFSLDSAPDMVIWVNADGSFSYCNQAVYDQLGYSETEIDSMKVWDIYENFSEEEMPEAWEDFRNEKVALTEGLLKCKNGRIMPVEVKSNFIEFEGKELNCSVVRDITERKKREKELQLLSAKLASENLVLREEVELNSNFDSIISKSKEYRPVLKQIEQVAPTHSTVLITGETGTGKELLARSIHQLSTRNEQPLVKVNCAALPANLIESELFGHEKGAFTGAIGKKKGRFEIADGGTIFLDEIGEVPLDVQAKLLRAIQEFEFERVGGTATIKVDVRIIAATNRDLKRMVEEEEFREDLYYRLNVFPIHNPPLRERKEDIPLLVQYFTGKYAEKAGKNISKIPEADLERLLSYDFPGNIRELQNIIERAVILSAGDVLNLSGSFRPQVKNNKSEPTYFRTFEEMQRDHILEALKKTDGKVSGPGGAAELLGLNDRTLTSKIKRFNINKEDIYSNSKNS